MAAPLRFESSWKKKDIREEKRKYREDYIEKLKSKHEHEEWKKEQAKARGEDTWMLPSVSDRVDQEEQAIDKSKKKKKEKKPKKEKKHKKKKKKHDGGSESDTDSDSGPVWAEKSLKISQPATATVKGPQLQREGWMMESTSSDFSAFPSITKTEFNEQRKKEKEKDKAEEDKMKIMLEEPGQHEKELNPYWKEGGTGLPEQEPDTKNKSKQVVSASIAAGDGGASWWRKAYQRCVEQAKEDGRTLEEVASERYGSLKKLESNLASAEKNQRRIQAANRETNRERDRDRYRETDSSRQTDWHSQRERDSKDSRDRDKNRDQTDSKSQSNKFGQRSAFMKPENNDNDIEPSSSKRHEKLSSETNSPTGWKKKSFLKPGDRDGATSRTESWTDHSSKYGEPKKRMFMKPGDNVSGASASRNSYKSSRSPPRWQKKEYRQSGGRDRSRSRERKRSRSQERRSRSPGKRNRSRERRERSRSRDRSRSRERKRSTSQEKKSKSRRNSSERERSKSRDRSKSRERKRSRSQEKRSKSRRNSSERNERSKSRDRSRSKDRKQNRSQQSRSESQEGRHKAGVRNQDKRSRSKERSSDRRKRPISSSSDSVSSSESLSSSDSSGEEQQTSSPIRKMAPRILTEQELNELGAKMVRAELMGNEELAAQLKSQIEEARNVRESRVNAPPDQSGANNKTPEEDDNTVVLTRMDRSGMVRPLPSRQHAESQGGRRRKEKVKTHGAEGRERYFHDDDNRDLKSLVEQERLGTAEDSNYEFVKLAGKALSGRDKEDMDEEFMHGATKKASAAKEELRDRAKAIGEHKKLSSALDKCQFCFDKVPKHLIIAIGLKVYLCLPNHRSMTDGHCLIVPMQHVTQSTILDEDIFEEIQVYRRALTKMFSMQDEDCVFMETCRYLQHQPHMTIECVPLDKELGDMAPIYFKKALQDSESEWSQNKKVVDLSQKNIRKAVPKGFPYFAVDFGLQGGFAHVIEDEKTFPFYFGREVLGGMLDLEPTLWRKPHKESFEEQRKKVLKFAEWWKPVDWTQKLKDAVAEDSD